MNRKPDIVRTVVLIFAVGLLITGFSSLQSAEKSFAAATSTLVSEAPANSDSHRN